jgi:hypothetical protein
VPAADCWLSLPDIADLCSVGSASEPLMGTPPCEHRGFVTLWAYAPCYSNWQHCKMHSLIEELIIWYEKLLMQTCVVTDCRSPSAGLRSICT